MIGHTTATWLPLWLCQVVVSSPAVECDGAFDPAHSPKSDRILFCLAASQACSLRCRASAHQNNICDRSLGWGVPELQETRQDPGALYFRPCRPPQIALTPVASIPNDARPLLLLVAATRAPQAHSYEAGICGLLIAAQMFATCNPANQLVVTGP